MWAGDALAAAERAAHRHRGRSASPTRPTDARGRDARLLRGERGQEGKGGESGCDGGGPCDQILSAHRPLNRGSAGQRGVTPGLPSLAPVDSKAARTFALHPMTSTQLPPDRRLTFPGYSLAAEIHRGRKRAVYRAVRDRDGAGVILKTLVDEYPSPPNRDPPRIRLLRGLDIRSRGGARAREPPGCAAGARTRTAVAQDPGGTSDLDRFFAIALPLVACRADHERR
jgi:hypothetical protein